MKLLLDMNLSPLWVPFLQQNGIDVIHWVEVGAPTASDKEIMEYSLAAGFVILTHDLDFGRLLAIQRTGGPSVVQIRTQDVLPYSIGQLVVRALQAAETYLDNGALVTIDAIQHRIRLLPI